MKVFGGNGEEHLHCQISQVKPAKLAAADLGAQTHEQTHVHPAGLATPDSLSPMSTGTVTHCSLGVLQNKKVSQLPRRLLKQSLLGPIPRVSDLGSLGLTLTIFISQVMPVLLVQRPYFENHWCSRNSWPLPRSPAPRQVHHPSAAVPADGSRLPLLMGNTLS